MKIRTAKKIMLYNPNCKINYNRIKRFNKLRPPYELDGRIYYSSHHDIAIVRRARVRLLKWIRNNK